MKPTPTARLAIPSLLAAFLLSAPIACEKEGPAERTGRNIDKATERAGDKVKEAGDKIKDAADR